MKLPVFAHDPESDKLSDWLSFIFAGLTEKGKVESGSKKVSLKNVTGYGSRLVNTYFGQNNN